MNEERLYQVLLGAHISEKATNVADTANQITFKVAKDATRTEIKEAVQKLYDVEVRGVTVLNMKGKVKRRFTGASRKPNWKKAYVTLAEGQDIDFTSLSNG